MDIVNSADKKYSEIRDKKIEEAMKMESWGARKMAFAKANTDYEEKMADIRAYADKLRKIQSKFFS